MAPRGWLAGLVVTFVCIHPRSLALPQEPDNANAFVPDDAARQEARAIVEQKQQARTPVVEAPPAAAAAAPQPGPLTDNIKPQNGGQPYKSKAFDPHEQDVHTRRHRFSMWERSVWGSGQRDRADQIRRYPLSETANMHARKIPRLLQQDGTDTSVLEESAEPSELDDITVPAALDESEFYTSLRMMVSNSLDTAFAESTTSAEFQEKTRAAFLNELTTYLKSSLEDQYPIELLWVLENIGDLKTVVEQALAAQLVSLVEYVELETSVKHTETNQAIQESATNLWYDIGKTLLAIFSSEIQTGIMSWMGQNLPKESSFLAATNQWFQCYIISNPSGTARASIGTGASQCQAYCDRRAMDRGQPYPVNISYVLPTYQEHCNEDMAYLQMCNGRTDLKDYCCSCEPEGCYIALDQSKVISFEKSELVGDIAECEWGKTCTLCGWAHRNVLPYKIAESGYATVYFWIMDQLPYIIAGGVCLVLLIIWCVYHLLDDILNVMFCCCPEYNPRRLMDDDVTKQAREEKDAAKEDKKELGSMDERWGITRCIDKILHAGGLLGKSNAARLAWYDRSIIMAQRAIERKNQNIEELQAKRDKLAERIAKSIF